MDKKIEKSNKDKVLRRVAKKIKDQGFLRTKPTFFVRVSGNMAEFIHIHKFTFGPSFRVHVCLRVLNDSRDFIALLGIDSTKYETSDSPNGKKYNFSYHTSEETIERCATNIQQFINDVTEPWYSKWHNNVALLNSKISPLPDEERAALKMALDGKANENNLRLSRQLLKIA